MPYEPIHLAANQADIDAVRRELGEGVSPNLLSDGLVPLHYLLRARQWLCGERDYPVNPRRRREYVYRAYADGYGNN